MILSQVAGSLHRKSIEIATQAKLRVAKAYSSSYEDKEDGNKYAPKYHHKNFKEVIEHELKNKDDDVLIVQAGSIDITNFKTDKQLGQNVEYFKQHTSNSAKSLFLAVSDAEKNNPQLKKIVILKQIPRHDFQASNPPGLKPFLSKLYNDTLDHLFLEHPVKSKITIGNHNLECSGGVFEARYRNTLSGKYDGVHMYGPSGIKAYTSSVLQILRSANLVTVEPPKYYEVYDEHKTCEQARYQARQFNRRNELHTKSNRLSRVYNSKKVDYEYEVPTSNRFATLGDFFLGNF